MTELTNDEINKYIHEQIMGKCWHEWVHQIGSEGLNKPTRFVCSRCDAWSMYDGRPDYCSDDSPRRLLNEAVTKVWETVAYHEWAYFLSEVITNICPCCDTPRLLTATAEQIARACVAAHMEAKEL